MLLLASFPVYVIGVSSSGFEIVNLLFALIAFLLLDFYLEKLEPRHAELLGLTLVLLAQVRYESALFVLCLVPPVIAAMGKEQIRGLTWRTPLLPLLFLPVAWQRLATADLSYFQMPDGGDLFSIGHLIENTGHAWDYFTGVEEFFGTAPLLFYLALAGLAWALFQLVRNGKRFSPRVQKLCYAAGAALVLQGVVLFTYSWGRLDQPYSIRLGIIFLPLLVFFVLFLLQPRWERKPNLRSLWFVGGAALLLFHWPVAGKNEAARHIHTYRDYQMALRFLNDNFPRKNILIISDRPGLFTPHLWGAVKFSTANRERKEIMKKFRRRLFQEIIVIQKISYEDDQPDRGTRLHQGFKLQTLFESQATAITYLRFSRVLRQ